MTTVEVNSIGQRDRLAAYRERVEAGKARERYTVWGKSPAAAAWVNELVNLS